ncbi:MAG: 16S rRNA (cytidine(1402)-2'-O)-methyltransferase [Candidatus Cloacimonadota bacterium]|nr:MAG: 16S rRNA (cytidine(1402)-2'-O)-methyltransferase [Candidatus Cloacimonadota bacterium]PIE77419.1 MAG: 16S rRNA (cytidine(1402)-2'-O)-methyltransferase [Candidatus Delongbacteria bacterium]
MKGQLYLVSIPIGNYDDISLRALKVLKSVDIIFCEEQKSVNRIFHEYDFKKDYFLLNEHNEKKDSAYATEFIMKGENAALISDCGTPLFADPGKFLVKECIKKGIKIVPVPGASSLLSALVVSGFDISTFYYHGFLPKKDFERENVLKSLKSKKDVIVLMETPYRILNFMESMVKIFPKASCCFVYKATMPQELILRGKPKSIKLKIEELSLKGEFVMVINNRNTSEEHHEFHKNRRKNSFSKR